jgi:hypothetical protein
MKVRLTFTLDVDEEAWANEYGLYPKEVHEDVRAMFLTYMLGSRPRDNGLVREVRLA